MSILLGLYDFSSDRQQGSSSGVIRTVSKETSGWDATGTWRRNSHTINKERHETLQKLAMSTIMNLNYTVIFLKNEYKGTLSHTHALVQTFNASCSIKKRRHGAKVKEPLKKSLNTSGKWKGKTVHLTIVCFDNFKDKVHLGAKEVKLWKVKWAEIESWEVECDKHLAGKRRARRLFPFVDIWKTWTPAWLAGHHKNQTLTSMSLLLKSFCKPLISEKGLRSLLCVLLFYHMEVWWKLTTDNCFNGSDSFTQTPLCAQARGEAQSVLKCIVVSVDVLAAHFSLLSPVLPTPLNSLKKNVF